MTDLGMLIGLGLQALTRNRMRAALTVLGIVIGVAAVIATLAIGQGARAAVQAQINNLGANVITVMPGTMTASGARMGMGQTQTLTPEDADAIIKECPAVAALSPGVRRNSQVVAGNQNWATTVQGVAPAYLDVRQWPVDDGAMFSDSDVRGAAKVCVLGSKVHDQLFSAGTSAIGQTIRVNSMPFRVVGVLSSKGGQGMMGDQDDVVLIPWTTCQRKLAGITWLQNISLSAASEAEVPAAQSQISELLRQRHHIRPGDNDDWMFFSQQDIASAAETTSKTMTLLLASIAAVSLLVGGIGIMNIMLVSVTERTREIGIRMAVGARGRDVLMQFLIEAVVLSLMGGILGILLGVGTSQLLSKLNGWPTLVSPTAVVVAFVFSGAVGIFFGYYPARKAAQLDPIEALRYE